jgi:hypothetical protein
MCYPGILNKEHFRIRTTPSTMILVAMKQLGDTMKFRLFYV